MDTPLLWHIPLSHFNEKARWALDYKGIAHRRQVLGPDYLVRAWRATGQGKLPILFLDDQAISDSTRIIAALEERYKEPPLYPREPALRKRALELEDDFDETLGPALRASIITPIFRQDRDLALRILTTGIPEAAYRRLENDRAAVGAALDRIERERDGRAYLVGASFTVADLTAASLLSPLLQPPEIQYPLRVELPPDIQDYRAALLRHPAAQWALDIYRQHRGGSMEVRRKAPA
jgi:glutathione S-transferase